MTVTDALQAKDPSIGGIGIQDRTADKTTQFQVGRLDQATFDSRLNTAINATVRWELDLMLADLPAAV